MRLEVVVRQKSCRNTQRDSSVEEEEEQEEDSVSLEDVVSTTNTPICPKISGQFGDGRPEGG